MDEEKIKELQHKIELLARQFDKYRSEILELRRELESLSFPDGPKPSPARKPDTHHLPPAWSLENFVGLKLIHFVGIIVLVTGLAIGVKYAIDKNLISSFLRIALAYSAAALLLFISYRLKKNYELFSMILFGGAMATAYFTTYAAFAYYSMFSVLAAFGLMMILTVYTVYQSLRYNRQEIAVLGLVGAYGIPFLVRGNQENVFLLFTYMLLINIGVLFLLFKKYWSSLIYFAFFITWIIFLSWAFFDFAHTHPDVELYFSLAFFILFAVSTISFKIVKQQPINPGDACLFILNLFALYVAFVHQQHLPRGVYPAGNTLVFGLASVAGFFISMKVFPAQLFFRDSILLFGLFMLIIFVPMEYERFTITIIWILLAVLLFIGGVWKKYKLLRVSAIGLFAITLFKLVLLDSRNFTSVQKIIAFLLTGTILLIVSFLYQKFKHLIFDEGDDSGR